jgi:ADP-heptose:LPS heptosyltransferase
MQGLGDNIHQRAIVRELTRKQVVYLETPWPSVYHDLRGPNLKLVCKLSSLRTQMKNMEREASRYDMTHPPQNFGDRVITVWYSGYNVVQEGSVLAAMCNNASITERDFSLPVPDEWKYSTMEYLGGWTNGKPLLVYRPLVQRTEWEGCHARNPLIDQYHDIFQSIRDQFYVVSIADLVPHIEWIASKPINSDLELHAGELPFEVMAGLFARASMVYASPGFAVPLAQAVGTPVVCVFGGYEDSRSFAGGAALAPYLGIDPKNPCTCFVHNHKCLKEIDVPSAIARLHNFVENHIHADPTDDGGEVSGQLELAL